jgi:small-conductance mechanosensitive channel
MGGRSRELRNARLHGPRRSGRQIRPERASGASQALQQVVEANEGANVHVDDRGDVAIVYVGERPILAMLQAALAAGVSRPVTLLFGAREAEDLYALDEIEAIARAWPGDFRFVPVLSATTVDAAWQGEQGLVTDKIPALRVQSIEVVRPATLRLVLAGSVRIIAVLLQIGIVYAWLIFALYIFEPTREYTGRLTEIVLMPLSGLMSKVVTSLPSIIIATASIAALLVLVRFVGLYFESAARGETAIGWVSPDLASATSLVVRFTIVILFLVVAIPYITGTDSSLARVGLVAIVSLGLAATPMLASMCVGIAVVYGRALHPGDFINFGPHAGRIETITLLELRLHDEHGCEVRVPHLLGLFYPLRVPGKSRPVTATVTVSPKIAQPAVRQLLLEVASTIGTEPELEFFALDQGGASYRVTVRSELLDAQHRLYCAIGDALVERAVPLGTAPKTSAV